MANHISGSGPMSTVLSGLAADLVDGLKKNQKLSFAQCHGYKALIGFTDDAALDGGARRRRRGAGPPRGECASRLPSFVFAHGRLDVRLGTRNPGNF